MDKKRVFGTGRHLATARGRLTQSAAKERQRTHDAGTLRSLCLINTVIDLADNLSLLAVIEVMKRVGGKYHFAVRILRNMASKLAKVGNTEVYPSCQGGQSRSR
jgi:hypothetical protein